MTEHMLDVMSVVFQVKQPEAQHEAVTAYSQQSIHTCAFLSRIKTLVSESRARLPQDMKVCLSWFLIWWSESFPPLSPQLLFIRSWPESGWDPRRWHITLDWNSSLHSNCLKVYITALTGASYWSELTLIIWLISIFSSTLELSVRSQSSAALDAVCSSLTF